MGLYKDIVSDDGVPLTYHRISAIMLTTNIENLIEVKSYPLKATREKELVMLAGEDPGYIPFTVTRWYSAPYDPAMTIEDAYAWLRDSEIISVDNPNPFLGAEDVLEEEEKQVP